MHNRWHPGPRADRRGRARRGGAARDRGRARRAAHPREHARRRGRAEPRARPSADRARSTSRGAEPGDVLEIEFVVLRDGRLRRHRGDPGLRLPRRPLPRALPGQVGDRGRLRPVGGAAGRRGPGGDVRRRRRSRAVARACWSASGGARRRCATRGEPVADPLPEEAVPPEAADGLRTIPPRETGGNLDVRQLVAGSRLWLPVEVPGALFSIGDLHFAQGDGEVCGTAIEIAGAVTVRFALRQGTRVAAALPQLRDAGPARPALVRDDRASRSTPGWT